MAEITLKGNKIHTIGNLPNIGEKAPDFVLVGKNLNNQSLKDFSGKKVLSIFPSLDTDVCAASVRKFNQETSKLSNTSVLCISCDLPFAHKRFCETENIENVHSLSVMRDKDFAKDYGVLITDGPLEGLCARALIVLDENNHVIYKELVPEIAQEPNYQKVLEALD